MRSPFVAITVLALAAGLAGAQFHDPIYLFGGSTSTNTAYFSGVNMLDNTGPKPVVTQLINPDGTTYAMKMDYDNRHVILGLHGSTSATAGPLRGGLFRFDPVAKTYTTIIQGPIGTVAYWRFAEVNVNQDGDYLCGVYKYDKTATNSWELWKVDQSGKPTTVLTSTAMGVSTYFSNKAVRNILNGKYLYPAGTSATGYAVWEIGKNGTFSTWAGGVQGNRAWYGNFTTAQNFQTGYLEAADGYEIMRLKPGDKTRTTIATLTGLPNGIYVSGGQDLQTAPRPRQMYVGYSTSPYETWLAYIDTTSWAVTTLQVSSTHRTASFAFGLYEGRHTQTVLVAPNKWQVRFSAPNYPGKAYVAAVGITGVVPGLWLPDGRKIMLNFDVVSLITLNNLVPAIWNGGPGMLDSNGEAQGMLDLTIIGGLGIPIWIVWVVLDPLAPNGFAYIPDPYVMDM